MQSQQFYMPAPLRMLTRYYARSGAIFFVPFASTAVLAAGCRTFVFKGAVFDLPSVFFLLFRAHPSSP
jgi:hypothetical protein